MAPYRRAAALPPEGAAAGLGAARRPAECFLAKAHNTSPGNGLKPRTDCTKPITAVSAIGGTIVE